MKITEKFHDLDFNTRFPKPRDLQSAMLYVTTSKLIIKSIDTIMLTKYSRNPNQLVSLNQTHSSSNERISSWILCSLEVDDRSNRTHKNKVNASFKNGIDYIWKPLLSDITDYDCIVNILRNLTWL